MLVLQHGNRSVSSKVGSADLFESIGFEFDTDIFSALEYKNKYIFFICSNFHNL